MRTLLAFAFVALSLSSKAFAAEPVIYKTEGASHYENGQVSLREHGNSIVMKSNLVDQGRIYAVEATLDPQGGNQYRGAGRIFVRYDDGTGCIHKFGIAITFKGNEAFLRENTPATIPYDPNGPCIPAGPYEWFNHPEPYVAQLN